MGSTSFLPQITTTSHAKESVSPVCDILSYFLHFICNWCLFVDCSISLSHLYYLLPEAFQCICMIFVLLLKARIEHFCGKSDARRSLFPHPLVLGRFLSLLKEQ